MSHVHLDFETRSAANLKYTGADVYAEHPTTDILCAGFAIEDDPVFMWRLGDAPPEILFDEIKAGSQIFAHNAPFELALWNKCAVKKYGWPELPVEQTFCTSAMAYAMGLPGSLEKAAAAAGIKNQKDMVGSRIMMKLCQPKEITGDIIVWHNNPEDYKKLYAYCAKDVEVERELSQRLLQLRPAEREIWLLDYKINQRGIRLDARAAKAAIAIVEAEEERLNQRMREITKNQVATTTATKQLTDWLHERGVKVEGVAKADVLEALEIKGLPQDCREALLCRQEAAKSSTKKLDAMLSRLGSDGRIRGIFQYHGAATGRWAGRGIQPQNFPRPKLGEAEIEDVFNILGKVI